MPTTLANPNAKPRATVRQMHLQILKALKYLTQPHFQHQITSLPNEYGYQQLSIQ